MSNYVSRLRAACLSAVLAPLVLASSALAGSPTHLQNPVLGIGGFNHACGAAVDSAGDVYVASAGESRIRVFDPEQQELTSIENTHEPCGLAVDAKGQLYVTEKATGEVIRYAPSVYPLTSGATYGSPTTIDASGIAKGISVDPHDDRLYVAEGTRIAVYKSDGGLEGDLGEGDLTNATGVAAYTYVFLVTEAFNGSIIEEKATRYVYAADAGSDEIEIFRGEVKGPGELRNFPLAEPESHKAIAGPDAAEAFGFGAAGAYLAVDPGNRLTPDPLEPKRRICVPVAGQACTAGHLVVYDDAHGAVDEFDATGRFIDRFASPGIADAQPSSLAIDRSGDANDGTIYVTAGAGTGAELLAFGPLAAPSRSPVPALSHVLPSANSVATDSFGDVYVSAGALIHVFDSSGTELKVGPAGKGIPDSDNPIGLAVDSTGKVYVLDNQKGFPEEQQVTYYTPNSYPPVDGTTYGRHEPPIDTLELAKSIAINRANDHLFVSSFSETHELDSAEPGHDSALLDSCFACIDVGIRESIAIDGGSGDAYFGSANRITVVTLSGDRVLARIDGSGSPNGKFGSDLGKIAVEQPSGHPVVFEYGGAAQDYDASGAFLSEAGHFTALGGIGNGIAIDDACDLHDPPLDESTTPSCSEFDPADGTTYVAFDDTAPGTFDVTAFGPLAYGEPPLSITGVASGFGGGNATLNGTVNPNGFDLSSCQFEYLTDSEYGENIEEAEDEGHEEAEQEGYGFAGSTIQPCAESLAEIGGGSKPVSVDAAITGLDPEGRYRFRLVAANKYGAHDGKAGLFGPPVLKVRSALPVLYDEATLRGEVDPSGLETEYRFEYGTSAAYGQSTRAIQLQPDDGLVAVQAALVGLGEGTGYHFRLVAENEAGSVLGPDQTLTTQTRRPAETCPNPEYRTGLSASLPDCRAYELVTPAETSGLAPGAIDTGNAGAGFDNWLVTPRGAGAGERLSYFTFGTLPGFDGNGLVDGYHADRATGEGEHPQRGWTSELFGPTYEQAVPDFVDRVPRQQSVASDQTYSFWKIYWNSDPPEVFPGTLAPGVYLRTPSHFEPVGKGALGTDLAAESRYLTPGATHIVFVSRAHLEEGAPPAGDLAIYDRSLDGPTHVVSVPPDGISVGERADFEAAQDSDRGTVYEGASEDGSTVVFTVGGTMYARKGNVKTVAVTGSRVAEVGEVLGCAKGPASLIGGNHLEVRWFRNSVMIPGAGGVGETHTYATVPADAGTVVQCRGSTHAEGSGSVWFSDPAVRVKPISGVEPPKAPDRIASPTPSDPAVGSVETCDPGVWAGAGGPLTYQWYVDGDPVAGATAETYEVNATDVPGAIQCAVTAGNAGGSITKASGIVDTDPSPDPPAPVASASVDLVTAFSGASEDGSRVFYAIGDGTAPGRLFSFDLETEADTEIAPDAMFVNIAANGTEALFTSQEALTGSEENEAGEVAEPKADNLYAWNAETQQTHFVSQLNSEDFVGFGGIGGMSLGRWTAALGFGPAMGRAYSPARSTPDGHVFLFQSHARLTAFDNGGHGEIYRYEPSGQAGEVLECVSCDPSGAPPTSDALIEDPLNGTTATALVPNLTDDGQAVFFQSRDQLLPEDANNASDVYEWKANGAAGCARPGGCLALISSGQGETDNYIYGMSADGHDVFFSTREKLVPSDVAGSPSIYDARVGGGIPEAGVTAPCQGDACQGHGAAAPALPAPSSAHVSGGDDVRAQNGKRHCSKARRRVVRKGKVRCIRRVPSAHHHGRRHPHRNRAQLNQRGGR